MNEVGFVSRIAVLGFGLALYLQNYLSLLSCENSRVTCIEITPTIVAPILVVGLALCFVSYLRNPKSSPENNQPQKTAEKLDSA